MKASDSRCRRGRADVADDAQRRHKIRALPGHVRAQHPDLQPTGCSGRTAPTSGHPAPISTIGRVTQVHRSGCGCEDQRTRGQVGGRNTRIVGGVERLFGDRAVAGGGDEVGELDVGDRIAIDLERIHPHQIHRRLLGVELRRAHRELAAGQSRCPSGGLTHDRTRFTRRPDPPRDAMCRLTSQTQDRLGEGGSNPIRWTVGADVPVPAAGTHAGVFEDDPGRREIVADRASRSMVGVRLSEMKLAKSAVARL